MTQIDFAHRIKAVNVGPLVRLEIREETKYESTSDSYTQWEVGALASVVNTSTIFLDIELSYGQRDYYDNQTFLTSYNFISSSLIADFVVYDRISASIIFDGNFESHSLTENNSNLYLLTVGLNARF